MFIFAEDLFKVGNFCRKYLHYICELLLLSPGIPSAGVKNKKEHYIHPNVVWTLEKIYGNSIYIVASQFQKSW